MGLKIKEDKTKKLVVSKRIINKQDIDIGRYAVERVNNLEHLGVNTNFNYNMHNQINLRLTLIKSRLFCHK